MDFSFLKSVRFWKVTIAVALLVLVETGVLESEELQVIAQGLAGLLGVSATIRTVDRFAETIRK